MSIARGQVWRVQLGGVMRHMLIVEADEALEAIPPNVVCLMLDTTRQAPDTVVTVPLDEPVAGTTTATDISALTRARVEAGELVGSVDPNAMDRIGRALRIVLNLTDWRRQPWAKKNSRSLPKPG